MNHHTFINTLRAAADKALVFEYRPEYHAGDAGVRVGAGYHVTEVRAANVRAVDCGGREDAWAETVVQLWVPEGGGEGFMSAGKFVSIVERAAANVALLDTANVRVEYADAGAPAVSYHVEGVHVGDAVVVRLEIPHVSCKALERAPEISETGALPVLNTENTSCCVPPSATSCCT